MGERAAKLIRGARRQGQHSIYGMLKHLACAVNTNPAVAVHVVTASRCACTEQPFALLMKA